MEPLTRLRRIVAAIALTATVPWAAAQAPLAPSDAASAAASRRAVENFASLPMVSQVTLSPDGKQVAALMNQKERTVLITLSVAGGAPKAVLVSDGKQFFFNWIHWVGNERVLASVRFASHRDFVGTTETRLLSMKPDGSDLINLVRNSPTAGSMSGNVPSQQIQDRVIDWLPQDGQHVLLQLSEPNRVLPAVYKVNVATGTRSMVKSPERNTYRWLTDAQHRVRVGIRDDDGHYEIRACDPDGSNWRTLWSYDEAEHRVWPLGFGLDPQELYVRADHEGRTAVFTVKLDDPGLPRRLRLAHPTHDVQGRLIHSPRSGEVLGVRTRDDDEAGEDTHAELWDAAWRAQVQAIDRGLPQRDNRLVEMSADEQRYLVYSSGNRSPGQYYVGDRRDGTLALVAETYPDLDPVNLAGKRVVSIKAREGLTLKAYLTLPTQRRVGDAGHALPMVLLPHGGPGSRDDADFDAWTEFLANRGYAVLQVNFRGSDGYGREFKSAGLKRWGLEMQDDLTDAVQWAIAQQVADGARVCIVGASYGGYAALMGVVKTPELYRCAVSFAGVSDLADLIAHEGQYIGGRAAAEREIGRLWGDRAQLRATSPALQAERIRAPVLLVHGSADRVVPVEQSRDMGKALRRAGKTYRYIEQEGGDHHLSQSAHRLEFFKAMESFLDEHLQPQVLADGQAAR